MSEALDMYGKKIIIGDTVKVYALRGLKYLTSESNKVVGVGKVYSLSPIPSSKSEPLVWVKGIKSCHACDAVRIKFKTSLNTDDLLEIKDS